MGGLDRHRTNWALKVRPSMSFKRLSGFSGKLAATPTLKERNEDQA